MGIWLCTIKLIIPRGKESTKVWITQKVGKERVISYWKMEEISGRKAHESFFEDHRCQISGRERHLWSSKCFN